MQDFVFIDKLDGVRTEFPNIASCTTSWILHHVPNMYVYGLQRVVNRICLTHVVDHIIILFIQSTVTKILVHTLVLTQSEA